MTGIETGLLTFIGGVGGFLAKHLISHKVFVKKELCSLIHDHVNETLERIEKKIDKLNNSGGK